VRSRCFSLNLTDGQFPELAFQGLRGYYQLPRIDTLPKNSRALGTLSRGYRLMKATIKITGVADIRRRLLAWAPWSQIL
jgi:hypothetical protein